MRWLYLSAGALLCAGAGFLAGRASAPQAPPELPETYVDLSAATPEFREKLKSEDFVKFLSRMKFIGNVPGLPSEGPPKELLLLPEGTPQFPITPLLKSTPELAWPKVQDETLYTDLKRAKEGWVILNLWASWCAPCIAELPDMNTAVDRYADIGVSIITINVDTMGRDSREDVDRIFASRAVDKLKPHLATGTDIDVIAKAFGMSRLDFTLPSNIIYAPGGVPVATFSGGPDDNKAHWNTAEAIAVLEAVKQTHASK